MKLDVSVAWIGVLMNLDSRKMDEMWIVNSGGLFLKTGKSCSGQFVRNDFEAMVPGINLGCFMIMTVREGNSLWAYPGSLKFAYYWQW